MAGDAGGCGDGAVADDAFDDGIAQDIGGCIGGDEVDLRGLETVVVPDGRKTGGFHKGAKLGGLGTGSVLGVDLVGIGADAIKLQGDGSHGNWPGFWRIRKRSENLVEGRRAPGIPLGWDVR